MSSNVDMQSVRHSIAITKTQHRRHLNYNHKHQQTFFHHYYHHKFKLSSTTLHETIQIDFDGIPPLDINDNIGAPSSSQSTYSPSKHSLPGQVMDSLSALNINVQAQTHKVLSSNSMENTLPHSLQKFL